MPRTIWKYSLAVTDEQTLRVPAVRDVLCVQMQGPVPCLWAVVDPNADPKPLKIYTYGTGNPLPDDPGRYVGTYQMGVFVWHVFMAEFP